MYRFLFNIALVLIVLGCSVVFLVHRYRSGFDSTWMYPIDDTIQGIGSSLLFLFLVFLLMKPTIKISNNIAELPDCADYTKHLRFKIVNHSLFKVYDINIYIYKAERISISGNDVRAALLAHYNGTDVGTPYMQSALSALFQDTKMNALQLRPVRLGVTDDKIKEVLNGTNTHLEIHVTARHGLSGLQGYFTKRFHNGMAIKPGFFVHGFYTSVKKS